MSSDASVRQSSFKHMANELDMVQEISASIKRLSERILSNMTDSLA